MVSALAAVLLFALAASGCSKADPTAQAVASVGLTRNKEAQIPPACYTKTGADSNPCWVCHTRGVHPNFLDDWELQLTYSFSSFALENRWSNLFVDRRPAMAGIGDAEILRWVREDNYQPLREALVDAQNAGRYAGFIPDLDFSEGFDGEGFARDGSGWRALRYKPFAGTFWPTNGSTDDVMVRLPDAFRRDPEGRPSAEVYRRNLAILEAAIASPPAAALALPAHYAGAAAGIKVQRYLYPEGTEFLHTVRYLDPDQPGFVAKRMKEVRYSRKFREVEPAAILTVVEEEADKKVRGFVPQVAGAPLTGYVNGFGWVFQGFIEDATGRLRVQTEEEHRFCLGCHGNLGVTVDRTFALPRKVPGDEGWRYQDLRGMNDVPLAGHRDPEVLTYLRRVGGGDEFRANDEMLARFFPGGVLDEVAVRRAQPGGPDDLAALLLPSRGRALALNKAYLALVREQGFERGRDALPSPPRNVHARIANGATELSAAAHAYSDGVLWLDWNRPTK
ncbi:MAG TPA: hypothetical protein VGF45_13160 [Polyangia bacterium]